MPSIYTHYKIALDVKSKLKKDIQNIIEPKLAFYTMFSQSFDNLYYYNFLSLRKGKHIRELGKYAHTHKVNDYFMNMINYIKENNLQQNSEVLCYLFGAINHYISDSNLHPYINYRTGRFSKKRKKETLKYVGRHTNAEIRLDAYFYELATNKSFKKYKIYNDIIPKLNFSDNLLNTITYNFKETFNIDNMGPIFNKSYNQSKNIYRILMYDRFGLKKKIYELIDFITPKKSMKIASFSLHKNPIEKKFFNVNHNPWCNPIDMNLISEESWEERYNKTIKKAAKLINSAYDFLNDKITEKEFTDLLGNNSYLTGMDLSDKRITQYYEY